VDTCPASSLRCWPLFDLSGDARLNVCVPRGKTNSDLHADVLSPKSIYASPASKPIHFAPRLRTNQTRRAQITQNHVQPAATTIFRFRRRANQ